jgi:hypothetical protein
MQQAKVSRQQHAPRAHTRGVASLASRARLEDVEGSGEQQGELKGRAHRGEGLRRGVVGREDGYVEGIVLCNHIIISLSLSLLCVVLRFV